MKYLLVLAALTLGCSKPRPATLPTGNTAKPTGSETSTRTDPKPAVTDGPGDAPAIPDPCAGP